MTIADFLQLGEKPPPLRFLVIGGHAVGLHGHTRPTFDVDFLVRRADANLWKERIAACGLSKFAETNTFAQFTQPGADGFDLMFVSDETFEKLWGESVVRDADGLLMRIPSLDHLLSLKLHALKGQPPHRTYKDAEDVQMLARRNHLDLTSEHYRNLFLKHGSSEIYETILRILKY